MLIPHGPDALKPYKEITCSRRATVRTMCHPVRMKLLNRKDFPAKFLENLVAQLSVRMAVQTIDLQHAISISVVRASRP